MTFLQVTRAETALVHTCLIAQMELGVAELLQEDSYAAASTLGLKKNVSHMGEQSRETPVF